MDTVQSGLNASSRIAVNFLADIGYFFFFFPFIRSKNELMRRRPRNFGNGIIYWRIFQRSRESESLGNGRIYARTGRTINTAPINFSWRNNPLSGATSYHPRHEVEKGSMCDRILHFARRGGRTGNAKECARLLTLWPNKNENITRM